MPKAEIHIIAFHGWGFDASFWNSIKSKLSGRIKFSAADRGYFKKVVNPVFTNEAGIQKIIFTHSFGLHLCPDELLSQCDHLVIFGGFLRFYPGDKKGRIKKKLSVKQWTTQIIEAPQDVLKQFYSYAFAPDDVSIKPPHILDHDRLLSDLTRLDRDNNHLQRFYEVPKITILHGADDQIVSQETARNMYHSLRFNSQYFELLNAGHAFPVTHSKKCVDIVHTVLFEPA